MLRYPIAGHGTRLVGQMRCHHGGGLEACGGGEREIPGLEHGDRAPLAAEPREERKVMAQGWRSSRTGAVGAHPPFTTT